VPADSPGEAENITLGAEEEGDLWDFLKLFSFFTIHLFVDPWPF
jgi:hypothetical protein